LVKVQQDAKETPGYSMDPQLIQKIYDRLGTVIQEATSAGNQPIILCSPTIRLTFRKLTERLSTKMLVISYNELIPEAEVHSIGVVGLN
jgi:flagellar biosynthesis protein FlhA